MSGEYMSGPHLESQLSLCPGSTYTLPADRACDRFAICTRYARYFAFTLRTCSAYPPDSAPPPCRTALNLAPFTRNALVPPPPPREVRRLAQTNTSLLRRGKRNLAGPVPAGRLALCRKFHPAPANSLVPLLGPQGSLLTQVLEVGRLVLWRLLQWSGN